MATRISLLQNGSAFASILRSQASSPLAASAASSVSAVKVASPAQASVTYSILLHGTPALKNEPGVAVHQDGTWKVGDQSFCALLILESSGKAPAACASAAGLGAAAYTALHDGLRAGPAEPADQPNQRTTGAMGKASRTKQSTSRRERIAAQRAAERRRQVRNRILIASGAVVVVIVVVVVFVVVAVTHRQLRLNR